MNMDLQVPAEYVYLKVFIILFRIIVIELI
jgi:hypothetical protein